MAQFAFTVTDPMGHRSTGTLIAMDLRAAMKILAEKELVVTCILPLKRTESALLRTLGLGPRSCLRGESLVMFTQQLAAMLEAGLTLMDAFDVLRADAEDPGLRDLLVDFSATLGTGQSLTEVMSHYPEIFSAQYLAIVAAGESSGKLPQCLQTLADLLERSEQLAHKVRSAFYYPAFVIAAAALILTLMMLFVTPRYLAFYDMFGGALPLPTRLLLGGVQLFKDYFVAWLTAPVLLGLIAIRYLQTEHGRVKVDTALLRLPAIGPLFRRLAIARFARAFACLQSSGVTVFQSLQLVAESTGNAAVERAVYRTANAVLEGVGLTEALRATAIFTQMSLTMMSVGEQTGRLDLMLVRVADYYESRVETTLQALAGLVEPVIMLGVGALVGVMIVAMVLPVFRLATLFLK